MIWMYIFWIQILRLPLHLHTNSSLFKRGLAKGLSQLQQTWRIQRYGSVFVFLYNWKKYIYSRIISTGNRNQLHFPIVFQHTVWSIPENGGFEWRMDALQGYWWLYIFFITTWVSMFWVIKTYVKCCLCL